MAEEEKNRIDDEGTKDPSVDDESQDETNDNDTSKEGDNASNDDANQDDDLNDLRSKVQYPNLVKDGDTIEDYLKRVENAYSTSSNEGKRLSDELNRIKGDELDRIVNNPAKSGDDKKEEQPISFGDNWARSEMRRRNNEAFDAFVDKHPELQGDTGAVLRERVKEKFATYASAEYQSSGEVPTDIRPLLNAAWASVAPDNSEIDNRTNLKERMSDTKTSSPKKRDTKSQFSLEQIATAKKIFPTLSEAELVKKMAEYVK